VEKTRVTVAQFRATNTEWKSDWSVHEAVRKDLIPHYRVGRRVYIDLSVWARFCAAGGSSTPGMWRRICGVPQEAA
jgi:hypothetical protein